MNLIKPWTLNNRLHDKFIVVDYSYAMIGGRNIGDRYFTQKSEKPVKDRDLLIFNSTNGTDTVIYDMVEYYDAVWDHPYSKEASSNRFANNVKRINEVRAESNLLLQDFRSHYPEGEVDWVSKALPTNNISFIHNPIERWNKEPWVLAEIGALMEGARQSVLVQSPYVVPTRSMQNYVSFDEIDARKYILTNSPYTNPNPLASAGYLNKKKDIETNTDMVIEYVGDDSLHAKTYVIDDRISLIGSFNYDARSSFLSTESMVVIDSPDLASELMKEIYQIIEEGYTDVQPTLRERVITRATRMLVYFFDYML